MGEGAAAGTRGRRSGRDEGTAQRPGRGDGAAGRDAGTAQRPGRGDGAAGRDEGAAGGGTPAQLVVGGGRCSALRRSRTWTSTAASAARCRASNDRSWASEVDLACRAVSAPRCSLASISARTTEATLSGNGIWASCSSNEVSVATSDLRSALAGARLVSSSFL